MVKNDVQATTDFEKTQMAERRTEVVGRDFVGEIVHETITRNNCRKGNRVKFQIISLDGRKKKTTTKNRIFKSNGRSSRVAFFEFRALVFYALKNNVDYYFDENLA